MKKKILVFALLLLLVTACGKKEETKKETKKETKVEEKMQKIENTEIKDNETISGTIEGYTFKETKEETDRVKIEMENGEVILIVLSNKDTPKTIKNFKKLVSKKFYDGLIFHRVIEDFMIQGGDPEGTGMGGSKETVKGEFDSNGVKNSLSHTRGVISMARANNPNSASSQFFIVHKDSTYLDGQYAAFGKVFAGMEVVDKIAKVETDSYDKPMKDQKIKSIRFIEIEK